MIHPLSKRIIRIILLQNQRISSKQVASELGVSTRAVHYRLPEINDWLKQYSAELIVQPNKGLQIVASPEIRGKIKEQSALTPEYLSSKNRLKFITFAILIENKAVPIKKIAYILNISRGTVVNDLEKIEKWLDKRNLSLIRKPHFGVFIEGTELQIRNALIELISSVFEQDRLLSICESPIENRIELASEKVPRTILSDYLRKLDLVWFYRLVRSLEFNGKMTDFSLQGLVTLALYLAISVDRIKAGYRIYSRDQIDSGKIIGYQIAITKICHSICQFKKVNFDEYEKNAIQSQLVLAKKNRNNIVGEIYLNDKTIVQEILSIILLETAIYINPILSIDKNLIEGLTNHFENYLINQYFHRIKENLYMDAIKKEFEFIYKISSKIAQKIYDNLSIKLPEDEVAYLTMHLAAANERLYIPTPKKIRVVLVCNEGQATSWLLASRLRSEFPQIEIDAVLSVFELQNKVFSDIDAIISTVRISNIEIQTIVVSPLLLTEDIKNIQRFFNQDFFNIKNNEEPISFGEGFGLGDILVKSNICIVQEKVDIKKAIEIAADPLVNNGTISPEFVHAIKDNLINHGPYMVLWPGIALLHAHPNDGALRIGLSLARLNSPVFFGHPENDPVDILFVLATIDKKGHLKALLELISLINETDFVRIIRSACKADEIISVLPS